MSKWAVYARVAGTKYLGQVEANTKEEATEKAWDMDEAHVSLCHHCSSQVSDPEIDEITVEEEG